MKPPYNIEIQFHDLGATVHIGCKTIGYSDTKELAHDLVEYINNPRQTIIKAIKAYPQLSPYETVDSAPDYPVHAYESRADDFKA